MKTTSKIGFFPRVGFLYSLFVLFNLITVRSGPLSCEIGRASKEKLILECMLLWFLNSCHCANLDYTRATAGTNLFFI